MEARAWHVRVELEGPADANLDPDDPRLDFVFEHLNPDYGTAMTSGRNQLGFHLTVKQGHGIDTLEDAAVTGGRIVLDAMRAAGLEVWPVVALQAMTSAEGGPSSER